MKYIKLVIAFFLSVSLARAQTSKKAIASKTSPTEKVSNLLKAPFLKRNFLLDPALFPESGMAKNSEGAMQLNIKLSGVKSAAISIIDGGNSSIIEMTSALEKAYEKFRNTPDASGYTYEKVYVNSAGLTYGNEYLKPLEYKMVYHGTRDQRELAKAMEKMPKPRKLDEKPGSSKPVNIYDTDENNRIIRFYLLNYSPDVDKGYMFLSYGANYGDDKKNEGAKLLQKLLDGISRMKIIEQIDFSVYKDSKYRLDIALPTTTKFEITGWYTFPEEIQGALMIGNIVDASAGYTKKLENYSVTFGTIVKKSAIEKLKLYNGISIYSCTYTIQKKMDDAYVSERFEMVSILVPDNKIIKKPMQIILSSDSTDPEERNSLNAFILNSISMPGTLTKSAIAKVKETYKK